jgi:hypothetical protein
MELTHMQGNISEKILKKLRSKGYESAKQKRD